MKKPSYDLSTPEGRKAAKKAKQDKASRLKREKERGVVDWCNLTDDMPLLAEQVAVILGVSVSYVKKLVQFKEIEHEKYGSRTVFRYKYVRNYINSAYIPAEKRDNLTQIPLFSCDF